MNIEKMREEFEAWVIKRSKTTPSGFYPQLLHRHPLDVNAYRSSWVDAAWESWQASRESLLIELPIPKELCGPDGSYMEYFEPEHIERYIEAAGLKVAS